MVLVGIGVDRLDFLGGAGERRFDVAALIADERLIGVEAFLQPGRDRIARHLGVLALVPRDRQRVERGLGVPPAVGNDRDRIVLDLHDLLDALAARDLRGVEALHLAAVDRARLDGGVEHAGQPDVDAVHGLAGDLVGGVEPLHALADDLPILRILELDVLRRLDLAGCGRDLAVSGAAARGLVRDHAVGGGALRGRDLPFVGGRLDQHHARGGAALADELVRRADALAAGGEEVAPYALAGDVLTRRRKLVGDLRPVAFEFLGDQLGEAGERALAHLGAGDADDDGLVGPDHDPGVDFGRLAARVAAAPNGR